jgi:hypothetical protein
VSGDEASELISSYNVSNYCLLSPDGTQISLFILFISCIICKCKFLYGDSLEVASIKPCSEARVVVSVAIDNNW